MSKNQGDRSSGVACTSRTDGQTNRQTRRQTDRQTDRQTAVTNILCKNLRFCKVKIHNEKTGYYGARPRQTGAEHPPATKDSTLKNAADICGTLRLSPGRRVDMKDEVFTPPGGGGGGGGVRSLILGVRKVRHKLCLRLFRRTL